MATLPKPPEVQPEPQEEVLAPSTDGNGPGFGGGDIDDGNDDWRARFYARNRPVPPDVYRAGIFYGIASIVSLFATLTAMLTIRWVGSREWRPIQLPEILYANTAILVMSSFALQLARMHADDARRFARYAGATLALGLAFVAGQLIAWRQLLSEGVYVASNPGSALFYTMTAAHAVHLLGGIIALAWLVSRARHLRTTGKLGLAAEVVGIYWHFMDGLWLFLMGLLLLGVQGRGFGISL
ncbi:MAG: cytochrome c oxidase subunit 3 [Candidatus Acidiferrales bacterium]